MANIFQLRAGNGLRALGAALVATGLLAGCSSTDGIFGSSTGGSSGSTSNDSLAALVFGPPATGPEPSKEPEVDCPRVDIRQGASTLTVAPAAGTPNATGVRYQASIARTARECAVAAGTMTIRVGVQGRVALGPLGGPGQVDIPIRYAVVQEGVEPKTVDTKLRRVAVAIAPGQANVAFTDVAEDISFPVPRPNALAAYVVYVGFDPQAPREERRQRPQRRPR
jgi:hypothetical protein